MFFTWWETIAVIGQIYYWSVSKSKRLQILGHLGGHIGVDVRPWRVNKSYDKQVLTRTWTFTIDRRGTSWWNYTNPYFGRFGRPFQFVTRVVVCWSLRFGECQKKKGIIRFSLSNHATFNDNEPFFHTFTHYVSKMFLRIMWTWYEDFEHWHGFSESYDCCVRFRIGRSLIIRIIGKAYQSIFIFGIFWYFSKWDLQSLATSSTQKQGVYVCLGKISVEARQLVGPNSVKHPEFHGVYMCCQSVTHRIHGTGIFTYIWLIFMVNVGKHTIHGSYGWLVQVWSFGVTSTDLKGDLHVSPVWEKLVWNHILCIFFLQLDSSEKFSEHKKLYMLCVAFSAKLLRCCCTYCNLKWWPFCIVNISSVSKKRWMSRRISSMRSVSWSDCQHAGLSPAMFFLGGRFGVNMGSRAPKKNRYRGVRMGTEIHPEFSEVRHTWSAYRPNVT